MNRIWKNFSKWEDYKAGLFSSQKQSEEICDNVIRMFTSGDFIFFAFECLKQWPNCMDHNLSYNKGNRRSYIGQATACFKYGASIKTTCKAWEKITDEQRNTANEMADVVIEAYEKFIYKEIESQEVGSETISRD